MQQILIQTSVPDSTTGPWGVNRFSALVGLLSSLTDAQGQPLYHVIARNRQADRQGDDVLLSRLAESEVDQLWLFAVEAPTEANAGLTLNDGHGINAFVSRGGALVTAQAPNGLGHSLVRLGGLSLSHQTTNFAIHPDDHDYAQQHHWDPSDAAPNNPSPTSLEAISVLRPAQGPIVACRSLTPLVSPSASVVQALLKTLSLEPSPVLAVV